MQSNSNPQILAQSNCTLFDIYIYRIKRYFLIIIIYFFITTLKTYPMRNYAKHAYRISLFFLLWYKMTVN